MLVFGQAACSSNDEDNARIGKSITRAYTALEVASTQNTKEHARDELATAEKKLIQAQESARAGNYERADRLVSESLVNVHLATAKTEAAQVQEKVKPPEGARTNESQGEAGTR